jgi:NAD(P)H-dependent flavin oxidoreductase YrpB (nitropropane dioxygenase family)
MRTPICAALGIEVPIFAFSHCRDVVVAVSRAGGLGVLGALAFTPAELERELVWIDAHIGGKPYGVDVVMPASSAGEVDKASLEKMIPAGHKKFVADLLGRFEVPELPAGEQVETLLGWSQAGGRSHADVALAHPIRLLASALGPPPPDVIAAAHARGVQVAALVGTVAQAKKDVAAGIDIIVAQGTEAGGHTGEIGGMVLVPDVVDAVAPVPVLAAGGIATGRQLAAALALGAQGAWTGSVWLTVKESDVSPLLMEKILAATSTDTVRSRALTGKPARQLRTAWTEAWDGKESPGPLQMPLQFMLTAEAQTRVHRYAHVEGSRARELLGSPVGQIVGRLNTVRSTRDVIFGMVEECAEVMTRLAALAAE